MVEAIDRIGKPGNQDKSVQVIRITGNQDVGYQKTRKSGYKPPFSTIVENTLQIGPVFCKTKPISEVLKMIVTLAIRITNNNEL